MADSLESTIFDIVNITIVSPAYGNVDLKDVKFITHELNIYESIFNNVMSGDITLKDSNNLISALGLCGNEYLYIKFVKNQNYEAFEKAFRIVKVSEVELKNLNTLTYKIHFVSEEMMMNQQLRISKSYKGFYDFQIVADILVNYLQVPTEKIAALEETLIPHDEFIIPNLRPFEAINLFTTFTLNPNLTSGFLFYETQLGFKYVSLETLFNAPDYKKIFLRPQNILTDENQKPQNVDFVQNFQIPQMFDVLETVNTGGYSSSMIKLDLLNQKVSGAFSDVVNSTPFKTLNDFLPFNDAKNRIGQGLIDGSAFTRYFVDIKGGIVDKMILQRAHQLALLNNHRLKVMIAGDTQYEAGQVVNVDFPYMQPINETTETIEDPYKNGRYLVTSVRHRILENKYLSYLELCKDSATISFPAAVSDATELLQKLRNS